jgi:transposase InsO family protein
MRARYYWLTLSRDTHAFVRACEPCQRFQGKQRLATLPLDPVVVEAPFQQWGLDFIGQIPQVSSAGHSWILATIDYFTRWVEAIPLKTSSSAAIIRFLEENILTRFGVPKKIATDTTSVFKSIELVAFCLRFGITLAHSTNYYPQGNGLAESSNKNLIRIIRRTVGENKRAWDNSLKYALWADKVTKKQSTRKAPFELVYGVDVVLLVNLMIPIHKLIREFTIDEEALHGQFDDLVQLEEDRSEAFTHFIEHQRQVKKDFDKRAKGKVFQVGDLVLLWDKRREK